MMELLSCRYNMDTAIQLFNVAATSLDCVSQICRSVQAATLPCDRIQKKKSP